MPALRTLFMGTPAFAVPTLQALISAEYSLVGVVTQPDRPKGRGRHEEPSPVKVAALEAGLPVFQPEQVRREDFLSIYRTLQPEVVVVAAFGQILPPAILDEPLHGCINVHPSLLPKYRGAAPMNWTLMAGETTTGVTIMQMDAGVDTGDMLLQREVAVEADETYDHLHDRLARLGADLLVEAVRAVEEGRAVRIPQDASRATLAPRLTKEDGRLDWRRDAKVLANRIRGLSSIPGAFTSLNGKMLKIFRAVAGEDPSRLEPGTVEEISLQGLRVAAGQGTVVLQEVQLEGKKRMSVAEFLRGCPVQPGTRLG